MELALINYDEVTEFPGYYHISLYT